MLTATPFAAWWWATVLTGAAVLVGVLARTELVVLTQLDAGLWVALGLILAGELRPVVASARTDPAGINLATAFWFAVLLRYGVDVAVVVVALSTTVGETARRKPPHRALFNIAQYVLSTAAATAVLAASGWTASPTAPEMFAVESIGVALLAAVAYHVTNVVLVGTAVGWSTGIRWWDAVTEDLLWHTSTTGAVLALAPLVVIVADAAPALLPLLALPLFLLWWTAKEALDRERAAATDPLTGVANRGRLAEVVGERLAAGSAPGVLCLLDLDRFKEVNDTFGHATGDALLCEVAGRLRDAVRDDDTVARLGGDEFVLVLEMPDLTDAEETVRRIVEDVQAPIVLGGTRLEVELSAGVAVFPEHGDELDTLVRRADAAMYAAKSTGEPVRVYSHTLERRGPVAATVLAELRHAVDAGELVLHYQPQVEVRTRAVCGVEALLRWEHPTRGTLPPCEFLPVARRTATMRLITGVVLDLALAQAAVWHDLDLRVPVAVNASPHDLADPALVTHVRRGLARHRLPASALRIELTEDALTGDLEPVLTTLSALEAVGVSVSIDDFGAGSSSLTRLRRVAFDELKLDRSLITDLATGDRWNRTVVRAITGLTADLGVRCVAEGVESTADWEAVVTLGVDAVQGWLVARPMPAVDATAWLQMRASTAAVLPDPTGSEAVGAVGSDR